MIINVSDSDNYKYFDLCDVLLAMNTISCKLKVLWAFMDDGYRIKESDLTGYNICGDDAVFKEMFMMYKGTLSKETFKDFCMFANVIPRSELIKRLDPWAKFDYEEVYHILLAFDYEDLESYRRFFEIYNPTYMDANSLKKLLNRIPIEAYKYTEKYLKLLPQEESLSMMRKYYD